VRVGDKTQATSITVECPLLSFKFTLNFVEVRKIYSNRNDLYKGTIASGY